MGFSRSSVRNIECKLSCSEVLVVKGREEADLDLYSTLQLSTHIAPCAREAHMQDLVPDQHYRQYSRSEYGRMILPRLH